MSILLTRAFPGANRFLKVPVLTALALGIYNLPLRYLARTYGETNIHRFRHGLMLFRMVFVGLFRL